MEPTLMRAIERILGVVIGGVAIYLGYRLFLHLPEKTDSSGKVILPGGISVFLSRVGPGAFFALFGAIVVAISFHSAVSATVTTNSVTPTGASPAIQQIRTTQYQGAGDRSRAPEDPVLMNRRGDLRGTISILNRTVKRTAENDAHARDYANAIRDSKLALLHEVWADDWGNFEEFREWVVERGEASPAPAKSKEPRDIFHHGEPSSSAAL